MVQNKLLDCKDVANYFCKSSNFKLTNLHLQKLLYISEMLYSSEEHK